MKRLLIFALLGPPLGVATGLWVILPVFSWAVGDHFSFDYHQVVLLPLAIWPVLYRRCWPDCSTAFWRSETAAGGCCGPRWPGLC